jgi:hypothetical protein
MKSEDSKHYKLAGFGISIILVISAPALVANLENSLGQGQEEGEEEQKTTITDVKFTSPQIIPLV